MNARSPSAWVVALCGVPIALVFAGISLIGSGGDPGAHSPAHSGRVRPRPHASSHGGEVRTRPCPEFLIGLRCPAGRSSLPFGGLIRNNRISMPCISTHSVGCGGGH